MVHYMNIFNKSKDKYEQYIWRKRLFLAELFVLVVGLTVWSLCTGSSGMKIPDVFAALLHRGTKQMETIIWNVRMPRTATAIAVGAALALTGCVMQNVLRNPLASASTLGVSQGASFGAAFAITMLGAGIQVNSGTGGALTITNIW